jgi:hypothetical protein
MSTKTKEYWEEEAKKRVLHSAEGELFEGYWTKRYLKNLKYRTYPDF